MQGSNQMVYKPHRHTLPKTNVAGTLMGVLDLVGVFPESRAFLTYFDHWSVDLHNKDCIAMWTTNPNL